MMKRTKWQVLEDRMLNAGEAVGYAALLTMEALEKQQFNDGNQSCSTCGAPLPTEAAFAKHYLVDDERYLNLGNCPTRYNNGKLMPSLYNWWASKDLWDEAHLENETKDKLQAEEPIPLTRHICTECGAAYHSDEEKATVCNKCDLEAHLRDQMRH